MGSKGKRVWLTAFAVSIASFLLFGMAGAAPAGAGKKPWQPVYVNPNPHGLKKSALQLVSGPHGGTVKCHGEPLLIDPNLHTPRQSRWPGQSLLVIGPEYEVGTGPLLVIRCGRRGKVAWYLSTRDPLKKKRFRGPRQFSIPVGRKTTSNLGGGGDVVGTGGCYPREDGIQPPCAPDPPQGIKLSAFRVYPKARIGLWAKVRLASTELSGHAGGDAAVKVQVTIDANPVGQKADAVLNGDVAIDVSLKTSSRVTRGRHVIGIRITGRGFNYVNVRAKSVTLKAWASRRMG